MSKLSEQHNEIAGKIVADIVKPVLAAGGTSSDCLVLLESVMVGVMLTMPDHPTKPGYGDMVRLVETARLAAHRCADIRAAKAKAMN